MKLIYLIIAMHRALFIYSFNECNHCGHYAGGPNTSQTHTNTDV